MRKVFLLFFLLFFSFFFLVGNVFAAFWYVDNAAPVGGNGMSWGTAWNNFSVINWSRIQPGDTLYISGGVTEKVYYGEYYQISSKPRNYTFRISAQGTSNNPIIITKGKDPGHNGEVILDAGNLSIGAAIYINSAKNVIIENLTIKNYVSAFFLKSGTTNGINNILIRNNKIYDVMGHAGIFLDGWSQSCNNGSCAYDTINNIVISKNFISTYNFTKEQTDIIYGQIFQNLTIENNILVQKNVWDNGICDHSSNSTPHADAIQTYTSKDLTVRNNIIDYRILRPCSNTFMLSNNIGFIDIYGNIILSYVPGFERKGTKSIIQKISSTDPVYNGSNYMRIYNNIFVSDTYNALGIENILGEYEIKNNIFYSLVPSNYTYEKSIVFLRNPPKNFSNIDGNIYFGSSTDAAIFYWEPWPRVRSIEQMRNYGSELHGIFINPLFDIHTLILSNVSPAIDAGLNLGSNYALSLNGVLRPQGSGWDIGAFEYVSGSGCFPADVDCNGCISFVEISAFVNRWFNGFVSFSDVNNAIVRWLNGGC